MIRATIGKIGRRAISYVRRFGSRALILNYHRIAETAVDPWRLSVSPQNFAEQLAVLREHWRPISLQQLVAAQQGGRIPHRSVVITFDDGYAHHRHIVQPLLEQFEIPATFFVSTGQLESQREYWWDELEELLLQPGQLPSSLSIDVDEKPLDFEFIEHEYTNECRRRDQQLWAYEGKPGTRLALYFKLWEQLRLATADEQRRVMETLFQWAGKSPFDRPAFRPLSASELNKLSSSGLVEIGAHTVTHPMLSRLSLERQQQEVLDNKQHLQKIVGKEVDSFAFPFGISTDALAESLNGMGFRSACTTAGGPVRRTTNRFLFPRETVCNWDGQEFSRQLEAQYA